MSVNGKCVDCGAPLKENENCTICEGLRRIAILAARNRREYRDKMAGKQSEPELDVNDPAWTA
jgi:hypothetical protein